MSPEAEPTGGAASPRRRGRLRRSRRRRLVAGICGGIADWLDWNPWLVRVLWVVLPGVNLFSYLLLWLVLPLEERAPAGSPNDGTG